MRAVLLLSVLLAACSVSPDRVAAPRPVLLRSAPSVDPCQSTTQVNLDRIDQSKAHLDGKYCYWPSAGNGVPIYFIDSGIRATHQEFSGRVAAGADFVGDGNGTNDCFGHGTQMAGIAAGTTYGVAKLATIVPLRIIDCSGFLTDEHFLAAVDWILANATPPGVVNISLDGDSTNATNDSIRVAALTSAGFVVMHAAGNGSYDACSRIAGKLPTAIKLASEANDGWASSSNSGPCVDLIAPGYARAAGIASDTVTMLSNAIGTSEATAHASGAAALYVAEHPSASAATVKSYLISTATLNAVAGVPAGTPNRLLRTHNGTP